jgi:hypothetical protein
MRIGSTTSWRRHASDSVNWAIERTLLLGGVLYNQLSDTTGNNNTFTPIVFAPLNSANELLAIYSDSVRSVNPFRFGNIQVTNGANIATVRNTATANTTITLPSTTGTLALTSQVPASEYFIGETTTAQSINNSTTTELTLNGFTTSGNVGGFSLFTDVNTKVPSTGTYLVKVNPAFTSNATGYRAVSLQLNATTLLSEISQRAVDGTGTGMFTADVASLIAGDNV